MATLSQVLAGLAAGGEISVESPRPFEVIQRRGFSPVAAHVHNVDGPELGYAQLELRFRCEPRATEPQWEYKIVESTTMAAEDSRPWYPLEVTLAGDQRTASIRVPAGGWYHLCLRGAVDGDEMIDVTHGPFGVGEVFLIAGQSYAAGENDALLRVVDAQRRVVRYDWVEKDWAVANDPYPHVGDGGTIWPPVGDLLLPLLRVPVGFVNVAASGTSSRQWLPGTPLFERVATAGEQLGNFRFVLWQQGESDVIERTSTSQYVANLEVIRSALNERWNSDIQWIVAKSTLHPTVYSDPQQEATIRRAIDMLWQRPGFRPGPDTDILGGENRGGLGSRRHFTAIGQRRAATMWFATLWKELQRTKPPSSTTSAQ